MWGAASGPGTEDTRDTREPPEASRTASANAVRSSSSRDGAANPPSLRSISQPRGTVIRVAWVSHRSHECGSGVVANGPTTAVESEYTKVSVATAGLAQPGLEH